MSLSPQPARPSAPSISASSTTTAINPSTSASARSISISRTSTSSSRSRASSGQVPPMGYPGFTAFLASDPDLMVLRRFGKLRVRKLLFLQDEIMRLEEELDSLDKRKDDGYESFRENKCEARKKVMEKLDPLLEKYENAMLRYEKLARMGSAEKRQIRNLRVFLDEYNPVFTEEMEYLQNEQHEKDLVSLAPFEKDAIYRFLQNHGEKITGFIYKIRNKFSIKSTLRKVFASHPKSPSPSNPTTVLPMTQLPNPPQVSTAPQAEPDQTDLPDNVVYYGDKLMERIARTICLVVAWAAIVGPVVWLCYVESLRAMLLIIGGFVTVCLLILAVVNPKRLEIISVAAAYAAVLVVFMDGIREQADPELKRLAPGLEKFMNTTLDLLEGRGG